MKKKKVGRPIIENLPPKKGRKRLVVKERIEKVNFDFAKIKLMAEAGLIDKDFQKLFGISKQTWNTWKNSDEKFKMFLQLGKDYADKSVEQSLYKRAMGYQYQEVMREPINVPIKNEKGEITGYNREMAISKQVIKEVAPDVGAIAFWLKNRKSNEWKERTNIDLGGAGSESLTQMLKVASKFLEKEI